MRLRRMRVPMAVVNSDQKEVEFWQVDTSIYDNIGASSLFVQTFERRSPEDPDANRACIQTKVKVPATRLKAYYDQNPGRAPDLICMDIQGAELNALKSLGPYIRQVKYVILEAGFHTGYTGGCTFQQLHDHLVKRGFVHVFNTWSGHEIPKESDYSTSFDMLYTRETVSPIWGFFFDHGFEDLPLSSWTQPTHQDYDMIQKALNDRIQTVLTVRPRPTELRNDEQFGWFTYRMNRLQLIDEKEDPYLVVDHLNNNPAQRKKCVVTYLGYTKPGAPDRDYTRSIQMIRKSLVQLGFDGHLIYRVGGFPGLDEGRLKFADSPYSFKPFMLEEVAKRGYQELLWLDSACCPVRDIQPLFQFLEEHPCGFFAPGYQEMNSAIFQTRAYDIIMRDLHLSRPIGGNATIHTQILGLNMAHPKCQELMRRWLKAAEDRVPFLESDQPPLLALIHELEMDDCAFPTRFYAECPNRKIDYYKSQESALVIHSYDLLEPLIELPESLVI